MALPTSLYIHIPFCRHICAYCDFPKLFYKEEWGKAYISALFDELDSYNIEKGSLKTIYIGGGTPTALDDELLSSLLKKVRPYLSSSYEFTVEANPETITQEKAKILYTAGVNRVSVGVESSSPRLLKLMGRAHSFSDAVTSIAILKKIGISNINADMIYALPTETYEDVKKDIDAFLSLDIDHLSCYSLILEGGTIFSAKGIKEAPSDTQADQYELILRCLRKAGFTRYEVSNFARNGKESEHNKVYWRDEPYYGAGLGAAGYIGNKRYKNTLNFNTYCKGKHLDYEEEVGADDDVHYFLLTNLRLAQGFHLATFKSRFGFSLEQEKSKELASLKKNGLISIEEGRLYCTDKGLLLLDSVLLELF